MSNNEETAQPTLDTTIINAAFAAARGYPELQIRCPWCSVSVRGEVFEAHAKEHESKPEPVVETKVVPKPHEAVRLHVDLINATLAPLDAKDRIEVLGHLDLACAKLITTANAEVDALKEKLRELEAHNAQRHEEVWAARELLGAQPNETLSMAIVRWRCRP